MHKWSRLLWLASVLAVPSVPAAADTLFDDLGGRDGIDRLVTQVVEVWQADPRVASTFEDTNMTRLKHMLKEQFCAVSGGGCQYSGHSMADAHRGLHLATAQFNAVAEDLQTAMEKQHIPYSTQNRFIARLAPMHREIVTR